MKPCFESYATKLENENARLRAELEAAKRDMRQDCETCKFAENPANFPPCEMCGGYHDEFLGASGWQWRGLTPANCGERGAPFDEPMGATEGGEEE